MSFDPQWPPGTPYAPYAATTVQPVGPAGPGGPQASPGVQQSPEGGNFEVQAPAVAPSVDVYESADELVVELDAAGFQKDQIEIHADGNNLYVTADRSRDAVADADRGERVLVQERPLRLERTIPLPAHIDPEHATATHEDGVCRIVVQKDEEDRRHEIGFQ